MEQVEVHLLLNAKWKLGIPVADANYSVGSF